MNETELKCLPKAASYLLQALAGIGIADIALNDGMCFFQVSSAGSIIIARPPEDIAHGTLVGLLRVVKQPKRSVPGYEFIERAYGLPGRLNGEPAAAIVIDVNQIAWLDELLIVVACDPGDFAGRVQAEHRFCRSNFNVGMVNQGIKGWRVERFQAFAFARNIGVLALRIREE